MIVCKVRFWFGLDRVAEAAKRRRDTGMLRSLKKIVGGAGATRTASGKTAGKIQVGAIGERLAADTLRKSGYKIRETNFRCRQGEIDIVAEKEGDLVFVEVRTRRSRGLGLPEESVTAPKLERLSTLADIYIQGMDSPPHSWRIDMIAVELDARNRIERVEHLVNVT